MHTITFKGKPITLAGSQVRVGARIPEFTLTDNNLADVTSDSLRGTRAFLSVPSLDTGVCDLEVRNFNEKAASLQGVSIYAVSMDLPFAQKRWCGAHDVAHVRTLSDYTQRSFGRATGTLIEELGLLTRAVFIVDAKDHVTYAEYVPEVSQHPDYEAAYAALQQLR